MRTERDMVSMILKNSQCQQKYWENMNRATCGILDEFRDHLAEDINEIILPLLNVDRPMVNGDLNEEEPQQVQLWITSASEKNTFCYDKTIELFEQQIINPKETFVWGEFLIIAPVKFLKLLENPNVKSRAISSQAA